ncbi:MAG: hypothetical protein AAGK82_13940 [Pseudomonadota bacterium]
MRTLTSFLFTGEITFAAPAETTGVNQPVAEIVTFRLVDDADVSTFLDAATGMHPFLRSTGAMIARTLSRDEDGLWTDHIVWKSMTAAKEAADAMMTQPEAEPFMALIAPDGVQMRHAHIRLQQE